MKICIPIRETPFKKALLKIKKAQKYADFVEIWFDRFRSATEMKALMKASRKPVIAVCRGPVEKGSFEGTERERIALLEEAVHCGAAFMDCGIQTKLPHIKKIKTTCERFGAKLIISKHFWNDTPSLARLEATIKRAKKLGAAIVKIATTVKRWEDNVILFELTARAQAGGDRVVILGMGEKGKISRVGCPLLGGFLTYVALDQNSKTAAGQLTVQELRAKVPAYRQAGK